MLADWFKKIKRIGNSGLIFKTIVLLTQFLCLSLLISSFCLPSFILLFSFQHLSKWFCIYVCIYIYVYEFSSEYCFGIVYK